MGCGGLTIARALAEKLNLNLYDDRALQEEAIKMGIRSEDLKSLDEKAPGLFDRILSNKPEIYRDLMEAVVYEVATRGEGVILGHGSQMLLRDFGCALHVFIHASEASRIGHMAEQQGLSLESARKLIHKSDNEQAGFFRYAFHKEWNDPSLYDLIINTEKMRQNSAIGLISDAAGSEEINACSLTALDAMERLSQTKGIEAALLKQNLNLSMLHVEVPEKGLAQISGWAYSDEEKGRVDSAVKEVAGIAEVRSEVSIMPVSY
jgi:cytidylate kinase